MIILKLSTLIIKKMLRNMSDAFEIGVHLEDTIALFRGRNHKKCKIILILWK